MTLPAGNKGGVAAVLGELDTNRMVSADFAAVFARAYLQASDEVRGVIDTMTRIIADPGTDPADRESCLDTLTEALFPHRHGGALGVDLEGVRVMPSDGADEEAIAARMESQEESFAANLAREMARRKMSQSDLARAIGVGQPAVSMMLSRRCRPQRRTVEKIASALGVEPGALWLDLD
jgi:DNA-binding phage protein